VTEWLKVHAWNA